MKRIQTQKAAEVPATRHCLASAEHAGNKARPGTALSPGQGGLRWRPGRGTHARALALHTRAAHSLQTHTHARCTLALHTRAAHSLQTHTLHTGCTLRLHTRAACSQSGQVRAAPASLRSERASGPPRRFPQTVCGRRPQSLRDRVTVPSPPTPACLPRAQTQQQHTSVGAERNSCISWKSEPTAN